MGTEGELRALVAGAQAGDDRAWTELYAHVYPSLYRSARRRLPSDEAADDAVSETMLRALAGIGDFTWRGAGVEGWLYGILRNVRYEQHREVARAPRRTMPTEEALWDPAPAEGMIAGEEVAAVREAFTQLSDEDREVLQLRVIAGMSAEEAGVVQGRGAGAVRMAQSRALTRLRGHLPAWVLD